MSISTVKGSKICRDDYIASTRAKPAGRDCGKPTHWNYTKAFKKFLN